MISVKKFFIKVLVFSALVIGSVLLLDRFFVWQSYPYEYLGGMLNDKHKIAEQTPSPKLLWVGGSSGSFGINSDTLQNHIGVPVINMAFIAPLGTYFLMNDALKEVKKGDKLFISTEYDINKYSTADVIYSTVDYYHAGAKYIMKDTSVTEYVGNRIKHRLSNIRKLFWNTFGKNKAPGANIEDSTSVYFRSAFSPKGDIVSHVNNYQKKVNYTLFPKKEIDYSEQIKDINYLVTEAYKKGAEVYFVFPPLAKSTYLYGIKAVESVEAQIKRDLKCPVLGSAKDFVYDDNAFFDSFYHLNPASRDANTLKIIELYNRQAVTRHIGK